jgi:hypothetical protein
MIEGGGASPRRPGSMPCLMGAHGIHGTHGTRLPDADEGNTKHTKNTKGGALCAHGRAVVRLRRTRLDGGGWRLAEGKYRGPRITRMGRMSEGNCKEPQAMAHGIHGRHGRQASERLTTKGSALRAHGWTVVRGTRTVGRWAVAWNAHSVRRFVVRSLNFQLARWRPGRGGGSLCGCRRGC